MKTIKLLKEKIDKIFEDAKTQSDYMINLYKIAFENWNDIKKISGHPRVSETTNKYLFKKAIEFDTDKHPNVMNGGFWLDQGFGSGEQVKDWEINISDCTIEY